MDTTGPLSASAAEHHAQHDYLHVPEALHHLHFPSFKRSQRQVINVNKAHEEQLTRGDKIADTVAATVGS